MRSYASRISPGALQQGVTGGTAFALEKHGRYSSYYMRTGGMSGKKVIRIFHQMARSGATVVSRCLGCMQNIALLSEIHPCDAPEMAAIQAHQWHNLLTREEVEDIVEKRVHRRFSEDIAVIESACSRQGKILVLRDWSHRDFTPVEGEPLPTYVLSLVEELREHFTIVRTALVRHPIDQWMSLRQLTAAQGKVSLDSFLYGYYRFAQECLSLGFIRYEDFTRDPDTHLEVLCQRLHVPFDPDYKHKWTSYVTISGDYPPSGRGRNEILPLPRQTIEPELLRQFQGNPHYRSALEMLGYQDF